MAITAKRKTKTPRVRFREALNDAKKNLESALSILFEVMPEDDSETPREIRKLIDFVDELDF